MEIKEKEKRKRKVQIYNRLISIPTNFNHPGGDEMYHFFDNGKQDATIAFEVAHLNMKKSISHCIFLSF